MTKGHSMIMRSESRKCRYSDLMQVLADRQIMNALLKGLVAIEGREFTRKQLLYLFLH